MDHYRLTNDYSNAAEVGRTSFTLTTKEETNHANSKIHRTGKREPAG
jgi:hypothetical protein